MKFNISYPLTGAQKTYEVDDDKKCSIFFDRRMGAVVEADQLGDEFKGYQVKITGGNDKQGFPMRQGVLFKGRVRILMRKGQKGYRPRRTGEQKKKSIRGCIVGQDIRVLALSIVKKGDKDLEGLTNVQMPRRLGPKRLTRLRSLYGYKKEDGVAIIKKNIIRRTFTTKDGKKRQKAPKIQRLVTDARLRRKRLVIKTREARRLRNKQEADAYKKLVAEIRKRQRKKSGEVSETETKPVAKAPAQTAAKGAQKPTGKQAPTTKQTATGKQAPQQTTKSAPVQTQGKPADKKAPQQPAPQKSQAAKPAAQQPAPAAKKPQPQKK